MTERGALEHAIAVLEAQRESLGSAVVDASIAVMRDRMAAISSARPAEQRKLVTVLFADIEGWTEIGEQLDPEDLRQIQRMYFDAVTPVITGYGGAVEKYIGDAVVAVFGVPIAHEDDARRAVLAGLAIQQAVAALNKTPANTPEKPQHASLIENPLRLRVGIHTGLVMATIGSTAHDFLVTGDAVNLAARLQSAAVHGTVIISRETQSLIADEFMLEELLPLHVKGVSEPVAAYRVLGVVEPSATPRKIGGRSDTIVGRQSELAVLQQAITRLETGSGSVAMIIGDAGIGKSRLVEEAFREPAKQTIDLLWGRCLSYGKAIPYHLWLELLRGTAKIPVDAPNEIVDARLRAWINQYCPDDCDEIYQALARLLALTRATSWELGEPATIDSQLFKSGMFRAIETLVRNHTARKPLAIICEELEWADPSSVELLEHLAWLTDEIPLMLICILRPETSQPIWKLVGKLTAAYQQQQTCLWLQPLSAAHSEQLVANLLGGELPADSPAARGRTARSQKLLWRILGRAEGNPFFLEEAVRALFQSGALTIDTVSGQVRLRPTDENLSIPETIQSVLGARIDSLQILVRRTLQVAAVIGRDFSPAVLAMILPEETALDQHIQLLLDQDFIAELDGAAEQEYRFTHALVREVAYNGLLRTERRRYHRQVAEAFEALSQASDRNVEMLAFHWQESGEPMRAAGYLVQSGDRARRLGASVEATTHFHNAMELIGGAEDSSAPIRPYLLHERLGDVYLENLSDQDQARIHYTAFLAAASAPLDRARGARKLASIDMLQGDLLEAEATLERALATLSDLQTDPELNRVRCALAYLCVSRGDLLRACLLARQSIRLARSIDDTRGMADAYRIRDIIADREGNPRLALAYARRCIWLYGDLKDLPRLVQANNNAADSCRQLGQLNRASNYLQTGLEIAQRIGDTRDQALLMVTQAELLLDQGRSDEAIGRLLEALPLAQTSGVLARIIQTHHILGEAFEHQGRLEDAQKHLETARALCMETHHGRFIADILLALAHLAATSGDFGGSANYIDQALEVAGPEPPPSIGLELLRVRGYLALCRQQWHDAVDLLEESLLPADTREPVPQRAHAHHLLAQAYAGRQEEGDLALARPHLKAARAAYRRIGATAHLVLLDKTANGVIRVSL